MVPKIIGYKSALISIVTHLERRRVIYGYDFLDMLWNAGSRIGGGNGLEVIFPDYILTVIAIGCPVARFLPEIGDRDSVFPYGPRNICDYLLNE